MTAQTEAKQLNIRLEKDNGEWIAILANHPDLKGDEEVGFPAPSEEEALAEARAYRSIEQSSVFKFEYNEQSDEYIVSFADKQHKGKLLAATYAEAQKAYADMINEAEPPKPEAQPAPKQVRRRRQPQPGVPADAPETAIPPLQPAMLGQPNPNKAIPPTNITSGIGTGPGQLPPAQNPWETLGERLDRLELVLFAAFEGAAKALEEIKKK
jgi:hypothetical protein